MAEPEVIHIVDPIQSIDFSGITAIVAQAAAKSEHDRDSPAATSEEQDLSVIPTIPSTRAEPISQSKNISDIVDSMKEAVSGLQVDQLSLKADLQLFKASISSQITFYWNQFEKTRYSLQLDLFKKIRENKRKLLMRLATLSSQNVEVVECLKSKGDAKKKGHKRMRGADQTGASLDIQIRAEFEVLTLRRAVIIVEQLL
ncbi:hypothetical protein F511_41544 [Dorcoceras hygrometricum]|uniref:Uncharacterized protein n=1 Tax=Dorcoceras hygrometricum TaxID=472368 RepID=A0A2Z7A0P5_9LAMI|nr:hypothetical protein F511_41544 [Dorcoceras hygrometricum]